ncbi:MAG: MAPEG family protein [Pseudomonadota bacterium]
MNLEVTSLAAASLGLLLLPLALMVSMQRVKLGNVVFGHADNDTLLRRIRAHGNLIEYAPLSLILLGLSEAQNASSWLVTTSAVLLVFGRYMHAAGTLIAPSSAPPRAIGMLMTHASYIAPSLWLLSHVFFG